MPRADPRSFGAINLSRRVTMARPQSRKLADVQEDYKKTVPDKECCVCKKRIEGYYGAHEEGGTCSRACMKVQDAKPKYPDHTAEDFERRHGL